MPELTLSQALERLEAKRRNADDQLARMPSAEWSTPRGYALCNREQQLHFAVSLLRQLAAETNDQAETVAAPR